MANVTAAECVRTARDAHVGFDEFQTTNAACLRFLTRFQKRLLTEIAQVRRDAIRASYEIDAPIMDFEDGELLPDHILIHGGTVKWSNGEDDSELVLRTFLERLYPFTEPAGYVDRERFYPAGKIEDWENVRSVVLYYFPKGSTLTGLASALDLPGEALDPCATALALFMAGRVPSDVNPPLDKAQMAADAAAAFERYVDEITARRQATVTETREAW